MSEAANDALKLISKAIEILKSDDVVENVEIQTLLEQAVDKLATHVP